jgi:hypothetical protein
MGLKRASIARLCQRDAIRQSMPDVCELYLPSNPSTVAQRRETASLGSAPPIDLIDKAPTAAAPATAPAPAPNNPSASPPSPGRQLVIEQKTGRERWCDKFDGRNCLKWSR